MRRILVLAGFWCFVAVVTVPGLAVDPKRTGNQPAPTVSPSGGGARYAAPSGNRSSWTTRPRKTSSQSSQRTASSSYYSPSTSSYSPYAYGYNGYSSPFGYGYPYPLGTMPYVLAYNPVTGAAYLYPYSGGYSPYASAYGNPYSYYRNPNLGFGYPGAVFVNPSQLYGIGPIQQLMGVSGWF